MQIMSNLRFSRRQPTGRSPRRMWREAPRGDVPSNRLVPGVTGGRPARTLHISCWLAAALLNCRMPVHAKSYSDLYDAGAPLRQLSSFAYVHAKPRLLSATTDRPIAGLQLTVQAPGGDIVVPTAADGSFELPISEELRASNPQVTLNTEQSVVISVDLEVSTAPTLELPATTYFKMAESYRSARGSLSFFKRLFIPAADGLRIAFPENTSATATLPDSVGKPGSHILMPDHSGVVHISAHDLEPLDGDQSIRFDPLPDKIELDFGQNASPRRN